MRSIVNLGEMLKIKVRVHRRGGNIGMSQQFLHAAQVLARFKQMRGERMPEHVRMHVQSQSLLLRPIRQSGLDGARADAFAALADKHGGRFGIG